MIRKATLKDVDKIMDIIKKIIIEMKEQGNKQWDENYPIREDFINDIEKENLYVDEFNEDITSFICLNYEQPDEYKDLKWTSDKKVLVIHRMGVNPSFRRQGKAKNLIRYAKNFAINNKIESIRTDTNSKNLKMDNLFKKCGFEFVGEIHFFKKEDPFYCYDIKLDF